MKADLGIQRDQFSVEDEIALERNKRLHYTREASIELLLVPENSVTSLSLFTAMQRNPSNLISTSTFLPPATP